jgi:uncharacterized protein
LILPDVNVLVYAYRRDSVDHLRYKRWLEDIVNGPSAYGMAPQVIGSVVRVCTHPQIFAVPDRCEDVLRFGRTLLEQSNVTLIAPGPRHWSIFESLCIDAKATGNLVPDAWFAALAIEAGCEWITTDRDYARFPGLAWRTPF